MADTLSFQTGEYSVSETGDFLLLTLLRDDDDSAQSFLGDINVELNISGLDATVDADYAVPGGITFVPDGQTDPVTTLDVVIPEGEDRVQIRVDILDDALEEGTEAFGVSLVAADEETGPAIVGFPRTARVSIIDDETSPPPPPPVDPSQEFVVTEEALVTSFGAPMAFDWLPGQPNLMLIANKAGFVRVYNTDSGELVSQPLDLRDEVNNQTDRGLIDLALHPDFADNGLVYLTYTVDPPGGTAGAADGPDGEGNRFNYLVSYKFTGDFATGELTADPTSRKILIGGAAQTLEDIAGDGLLDFTSQTNADRPASDVDPTTGEYIQDFWKQDSRSHVGGGLAFDADGVLYVGTGDGTSYNFADPRTVAVQDLNSLSGKVLRIDPITGEGLPDNPYFDANDPNANLSKVYQLGLRNPVRLSFDDNGRLFKSETGWFSYEEINSGGPTDNFGWPFFEGGDFGVLERTPQYDSFVEAADFYLDAENGTIDHPEAGVGFTSDLTAPFRAFSHAEDDPGFRFQAIVGGESPYAGDVYPDVLKGDYFFTDITAGKVYSVDVNDPTQVRLLTETSSGYGPTFMKEGPDGYMYYADLVGGAVGRWQIVPGLTLQTADFTFNGDASLPSDGSVRLNQPLVGSGSDPAGWQAGTAFDSRVLAVDADASFNTSFTFTISDGDGTAGGEGLAFLIHRDERGVNALGYGAGMLGYGGINAQIEQSLIVEFDTRYNVWDPLFVDHVAVHGGGDQQTPLAVPGSVASPDFALNDGNPVTTWIDYDGKTDQLEIYLSRDTTKPLSPLLTTTVQLDALVGEGDAHIGFSASASNVANAHDIVDWNFTSSALAVSTPPQSLPGTILDLETAALSLNGDAFFKSDGDVRLNQPIVGGGSGPSGYQAGSLFATQTLAVNADTSFGTNFTFAMAEGDEATGGEGLAFVVHRDIRGVNALGAGAGLLGYSGSNEAIGQSLIIEFDTVRNNWDPFGQHVAVHADGEAKTTLAVPNATVDPGFRFNDGAPVHVWIDYEGATDRLAVYLSRDGSKPETAALTTTVQLDTVVGPGDAFVGFTASAGRRVNAHDILEWSFGSEDLASSSSSPGSGSGPLIELSTADLMLNGNAALVETDTLRLTEDVALQAGSAFAASTLGVDADTSFETTFLFEQVSGGGAGLALVIQSEGETALGVVGGGLGYGGRNGTEIENSFVIEFDTGSNPWDPDSNHVAVHTGGDQRVAVDATTALLGIDLDGEPVQATINYDGALDLLEVFISNGAVSGKVLSTTVELDAVVGADEAFVGFTAATGNGSPAEHEILEWTFSSEDLLIT